MTVPRHDSRSRRTTPGDAVPALDYPRSRMTRPARTFRSSLRLSPLTVVALVAGCGGEPAPTPAPTPPQQPAASAPPSVPTIDPTKVFPDWKADFPQFGKPLHLSPSAGGRVYERSRRGILEQVAANLSGSCSRDAWLVAKEFFARHREEEVVELLIERLDHALTSPTRAEHAENLVEAMTTMADPRFAAVLLRALEHDRPGVRNKAMQALARSGDAASVRRAQESFLRMEHRAQIDWIRAAAAHLGDDVVTVFGEILTTVSFQPFHDTVLQETLKLGAERAARVLEPHWARSAGPMKLAIAGVLHRLGDARGTVHLREAMRSSNVQARSAAVLAMGKVKDGMVDDLLMLTTDTDPVTREVAAMALADVPGESVDGQLSILSQDDEDGVRNAALRALGKRGVRPVLDRLIDTVRTATGYTLDRALMDLVAARDGKAVPVIVERYRKAPAGEQRNFLSAIGRLRAPEGFPFLREVFLGEERAFHDARDLTTVKYAAMLLPNLDGAEAMALALFAELDRADYRRRAHLLTALGNIAGDRADPELRAKVFALFRSIVFDTSELPQMRLLALEWLRRDLRIDDVLRMQRELDQQSPGMKHAMNDFLFEFF